MPQRTSYDHIRPLTAELSNPQPSASLTLDDHKPAQYDRSPRIPLSHPSNSSLGLNQYVFPPNRHFALSELTNKPRQPKSPVRKRLIRPLNQQFLHLRCAAFLKHALRILLPKDLRKSFNNGLRFGDGLAVSPGIGEQSELKPP